VRNLFLLLVLLNLGVLAWVRWIEPAPERPADWTGTGITLLRELDADAPIVVASRSQVELPAESSGLAGDDPALAALAPPGGADPLASAAGESTATVEAGAAAAPARSCVAVGPFAEAAQADAAVATLNASGIIASSRVETQEVWEGYWVYVGGLPSTERANAVLAELAQNGIADAYVIPDSDSGILISLGVFSDVSRAGAQAERAGRFGLAATITERIRTEQVRWIELEFEGEESQALALLQEPGRISRLEQRDCAATTGN
jgi:cell division septation protein DedD